MISCFLKKKKWSRSRARLCKFALATGPSSKNEEEEKVDESSPRRRDSYNGRSEVGEDSVITVDNILHLYETWTSILHWMRPKK